MIVPYFEGSEVWVEDYLEEYEMRKNKNKLQKEMKQSLASGESDLAI